MHFNPYNTVEFYVGEVTPPQTVKIYTDETTSIDVTVSEGNKWYSYVLPKDKGLYKIKGDSVKKVNVKADISFEGFTFYPSNISIIPYSIVEASFKGSNTSNVTNMGNMFSYSRDITSLDLSKFNISNVTTMIYMFYNSPSLTFLDLSGWDINKVTEMTQMFYGCTSLKTIRMVGCSTDTVNKIKNQLASDHITGVTITT